MDKERQIYIDPIFIKGNILRTYILWDIKTRLELRVEFLNRRTIPLDRFKIISFVRELLIRSGYELTMTKQEFINIQFKQFDGLKIKIAEIDF